MPPPIFVSRFHFNTKGCNITTRLGWTEKIEAGGADFGATTSRRVPHADRRHNGAVQRIEERYIVSSGAEDRPGDLAI